MYISDVMATCNSTQLSLIIPVVKNILTLIQIMVPILLIIMSVIEFVKLSINPEDKKGLRKILNKVIAAFIIFLIPMLINMVMGLVGENTQFSTCWNNPATVVSPGESTYYDEDDSAERSNFFNDPDDYE